MQFCWVLLAPRNVQYNKDFEYLTFFLILDLFWLKNLFVKDVNRITINFKLL